MVTLCDVRKLKARLLTRRFRSSVVCGREELLFVPTLSFFIFKTFHMHENLYKTPKGREKP